MMKKLGLVCVVATLAMSPMSRLSAQATVDVSKITCEQMLTANPNMIEAAIWLSGYYNGLQKNTQLDLNQFKKNAEVIVGECRTNPQKAVMQTVNEMLGRK